MAYKTTDDMREILGNETITKSGFSGILSRLMKQKAKEMGMNGDDYHKFCLDELSKHQDELPKELRCVRSLLTKENTLAHKREEVLSKKLLKEAKKKQLSLYGKSESD